MPSLMDMFNVSRQGLSDAASPDLLAARANPTSLINAYLQDPEGRT